MIREALSADIKSVENIYNELLKYESEHGAFTAWQSGVYPTGKTAENALSAGSLYVLDDSDEICASIILNQIQPEEYVKIKWNYIAKADEVLVVHLLCVPPSKSGLGYGTKMMEFAVQKGRHMNCKVIRLDTGLQNKPAIALYRKLGFEITASANISIGGIIEHNNHLFLELKI